MRLRSYTITNMASDCSSATTVEAAGREHALRLFAEENGYPSLGDYLAAKCITADDLAVHLDDD